MKIRGAKSQSTQSWGICLFHVCAGMGARW